MEKFETQRKKSMAQRKEFMALSIVLLMEERRKGLAEEAQKFVAANGYLPDDPCDGHSTMIRPAIDEVPGDAGYKVSSFQKQPNPTPASTVLTEEETESIYTKWCENYEKNPDPTDEGSYLFDLLTNQDTHTRQKLIEQGWKSPKEWHKETAVLMLRLYKAEQKLKLYKNGCDDTRHEWAKKLRAELDWCEPVLYRKFVEAIERITAEMEG